MRWLSILFLITLMTPKLALAESPSVVSSGLSIYIFGASWCAPCIAELRDMPRLAEAAKPGRIVIVWSDNGIRRFPMPNIANVEIRRDLAQRTMADLGGPENAGLPYTAILDRRGKKCGEWRGLLTSEIIGRLRKACGPA
jgi:thiol-disulfide isomerase/thioredoxin